MHSLGNTDVRSQIQTDFLQELFFTCFQWLDKFDVLQRQIADPLTAIEVLHSWFCPGRSQFLFSSQQNLKVASSSFSSAQLYPNR